MYSLKRPYRKNAKFIMNDQTIAALRKLKDNNGAYLWQPSLQAGEVDRLFGYKQSVGKTLSETREIRCEKAVRGNNEIRI